MKKKWAMKWVAALRSGNFIQGSNQLRRTSNSCCCLGVLEDITGCEWIKDTEGEWAVKGHNNTDLSFRAQKITGMKTNNGYIPNLYKGYNSLIALNDDGVSFNEIADFIEANYKKL